MRSRRETAHCDMMTPFTQGQTVSGLTLVVFCIGAAVQQSLGNMLGTTLGSRPKDVQIRADLCAMLGLAELSSCTDSNSDEAVPRVSAKSDRLLLVGFAKVALENVPQLVLQSSFLALVFDELTPLGRTKVLFSIVLGLASASQKILQVIKNVTNTEGG
eukprot:Skav226876  [mRNA]  locus=scaffold1187:222545:223650:+ [translate_table: standard]